MKSALYNAIRSISLNEFEAADKKELLSIFIHTDNALLRNHIAFIFSDLNYTESIPHIIQKIKERALYNANGSLVFALENMDTLPYFLEIIEIVCEQGYEARLAALEIIQKDLGSISDTVREEVRSVINKHMKMEIKQESEVKENSKLHFMEEVKTMLDN
ncbi:hypothetical protein [Taibaiella koreensis]|uniref:hypothetical protein n=1 Tax=Taibaiella koreensis TaxID=1268548 RepID=UPI000E59D359|nr:hypothetical protein [Taibaiella koreensis]